MFVSAFQSRVSFGVLAAVISMGLTVTRAHGQDQDKVKDDKGAQASSSQTQAAPASSDPLKRPIPEKQKKANAKALKIELSKTYKKWLAEDVPPVLLSGGYHAVVNGNDRREWSTDRTLCSSLETPQYCLARRAATSSLEPAGRFR